MKTLKFYLMHFILACSIQIGDLNASPFVHSVEVKSGWKDLTDQATIMIPKVLVSYGLTEINPGDPVSIAVGYEGYEKQVFKGYVRQVNPKIPLEIECEDASYLLKRVNINKFWPKDVKLQEIVDHVVSETNSANPNYEISLNKEIPDITFRKFRINNANGAQVIEKFKEAYGLIAFFDDHELTVQLPYERESLGEVTYDLTNNVIKHDKLEYRTVDQNNVKLKAISFLKDNQFLEVEVGDSNGNTQKKFYAGITDKATLKRIAEEDLKQYKFEGYKGSLRTFMVPFTKHGMTARIIDPEYGRDSKHDIESTVIRFEDGITIDVGIGIKV